MKELLLQVARPGRDEHLVPAQDGRDQVGEGLAGPGAGLADQGRARLHHPRDLLRHRLLGGAVPEPR